MKTQFKTGILISILLLINALGKVEVRALDFGTIELNKDWLTSDIVDIVNANTDLQIAD